MRRDIGDLVADEMFGDASWSAPGSTTLTAARAFARAMNKEDEPQVSFPVGHYLVLYSHFGPGGVTVPNVDEAKVTAARICERYRTRFVLIDDGSIHIFMFLPR